MKTFIQACAAFCCAPTFLWAGQTQAQTQGQESSLGAVGTQVRADTDARTQNPVTVPEISVETAPATAQVQAKTSALAQPLQLGYEGAYPSADTGNSRLPGSPFGFFRWAEDWRGTSQKPNRSVIERLKDIPIANNLFGDGDVTLTLSGQGRIRHNFYSSPGLRKGEDQNQILVRTVIGADVHLGDHVRVFGELGNGILEGKNYGPVIGGFRNKLTVLQSFIDAWAPIPGGGVIGVRYGRQEFTDGPPQVIAPREIFNIRTTFNGTSAWMNWRRVRVDAFSFKVTQSGTGGLGDDPVNDRERFRGINLGLVLANSPRREGSHLFLNPFYHEYRNDQQVAGVLSRDRRNTYGARLWGNIGRVRLDWVAVRQGGSVRNAMRDSDVEAWAVFIDQGYTLPGITARPELGFHYYRGSGGGTYGTGTVRSFSAPLGNAPMFGNALLFSPTNLQDLGPSFSFTPAKNLVLGGSYEFLSRVDQRDAVVSAAGFAYTETQNVTDKSIGRLARLNLLWNASPYVQVLVFAEHLHAGPTLKGAGFDNTAFLGSMVKFRF